MIVSANKRAGCFLHQKSSLHFLSTTLSNLIHKLTHNFIHTL
ncbi:hypothetical protein HMPREF0476_1893 [Kingella kingae ATCC 23330]|uniref:Uncharacterized protein n=1 Tax=Kingella kingae ATCC 23330 TaxID=887327 RepID=F5S9L0_KINKI|nr:hypothetical protein HMPREF0476_1893 [Kingella kingae ATCC 23330]